MEQTCFWPVFFLSVNEILPSTAGFVFRFKFYSNFSADLLLTWTNTLSALRRARWERSVCQPDTSWSDHSKKGRHWLKKQSLTQVLWCYLWDETVPGTGERLWWNDLLTFSRWQRWEWCVGWTAGVLDGALGFPHADGNEDITEP